MPRKAGESPPVTFAEVAPGGRVIRYLWASDKDDAAGYEPCPRAGDISLDAGKEWTERLSEAKRHRLSPSEALHELSVWQGDSRTGNVVDRLTAAGVLGGPARSLRTRMKTKRSHET